MNALIKSYGLLGLVFWRRALLATLPASLLNKGRARPEISGEFPFEVTRFEGGHRHAYDRTRMTAKSMRSCLLCLPAESVLRRTTTVPVAALCEIDNIIKLDLPISTPFEADEVLFDKQVVAFPRRGIAAVEIAMVQKSELESCLSAVRDRFGSSPREVKLGNGLIVEIDQARASKRKAAMRLDGLLFLLVLTMVALVGWISLNRQSAAIDQRRFQISQALAGIDKVEQLRSRIEERRQINTFLRGVRADASPILPTLRAIGTSLPSNISLERLEMDGQKFAATFAGPHGVTTQLAAIAAQVLEPGFRLLPSADGQAIELSGVLKSHKDARP